MPDQDILDSIGQAAMDMYEGTVELITWDHRETAMGALQSYPDITVRMSHYSVKAISANDLIEPKDMELRLPTSSLPFEAGHYDEVLRQKNGERWKVQEALGGPGHAMWVCQMRMIGGGA
jgi:hypothetical protein